MKYLPPPMPPEAYLNPYYAGSVMMPMIWEGIKVLVRLTRKRREVHMLERIHVLPPDWDAVGRYRIHPTVYERRDRA